MRKFGTKFGTDKGRMQTRINSFNLELPRKCYIRDITDLGKQRIEQMQGFIYGFKVFEMLARKMLATT